MDATFQIRASREHPSLLRAIAMFVESHACRMNSNSVVLRSTGNIGGSLGV